MLEEGWQRKVLRPAVAVALSALILTAAACSESESRVVVLRVEVPGAC